MIDVETPWTVSHNRNIDTHNALNRSLTDSATAMKRCAEGSPASEEPEEGEGAERNGARSEVVEFSDSCRQNHNSGPLPAFLDRTYDMVDKGSDEIVCWSSTGTSFLIKRVELFEEEVIPKFFNHKNLFSFVRQLNFYGFSKVKGSSRALSRVNSSSGGSSKSTSNGSAGWWEFKHPKFRRGSRELLGEIKRRKDKPSSASLPLQPDWIDQLKRDVEHFKNAMEKTDNKVEELKSMIAAVMRSLDHMRPLVPWTPPGSGAAFAIGVDRSSGETANGRSKISGENGKAEEQVTGMADELRLKGQVNGQVHLASFQQPPQQVLWQQQMQQQQMYQGPHFPQHSHLQHPNSHQGHAQVQSGTLPPGHCAHLSHQQVQQQSPPLHQGALVQPAAAAAAAVNHNSMRKPQLGAQTSIAHMVPPSQQSPGLGAVASGMAGNHGTSGMPQVGIKSSVGGENLLANSQGQDQFYQPVVGMP
ncbi:unnamed protein product, partial [Discosporangium mesarthrocarpum]